MNNTQPHWKKLGRKAVFESRFLDVYEDTVELPNGTVIDDYTLTKKPSYVIVLAVTPDQKIIVFKEYKYAVNEELWSFPAGTFKDGENPEETAKRELLEETGYTSDSFELLGKLYEYPTKDLHECYVYVAKDIRKVGEHAHEATETIGKIMTLSLDEVRKSIKNGEWKAATLLAAFLLYEYSSVK
ncbi:MAG: ADP-ribose pyrophosphatase [Patescibacteria group bacterium]|jgi:8-oxo-dGTP pyrophosphatase MutT (NUDIX family)|nr:ADP-ribose pyrophosphatase [Patescibacteria group bacterium]